MKKFKTLGIILAGVTVLVVGAYSFFTANSAKHQEELAKSDAFKNIQLETVDGNTFTSDDLAKSEVTVVNVWRTDCEPCVSELPALDRLNDEYDSSEVQIIGVCLDVTPGGATVDEAKRAEEIRIMDETGSHFTQILCDEQLYSFLDANTPGTPTTFFVASDGTIIKSTMGGRDYDSWKAYIDRVIA